jgi:hypothetical protein
MIYQHKALKLEITLAKLMMKNILMNFEYLMYPSKTCVFFIIMEVASTWSIYRLLVRHIEATSHITKLNYGP